jgi:hypothetical protein
LNLNSYEGFWSSLQKLLITWQAYSLYPYILEVTAEVMLSGNGEEAEWNMG